MGLSDNADFGRVLNASSLRREAGATPFVFEDGYRVELTEASAPRNFAKILFGGEGWAGYPSIQVAFTRLSVVLSIAANRLAGRDVARYSVSTLAAMHAALFAVAVGLLFAQIRMRRLAFDALFKCAAILVLCDTGYTAYFASFYGEALQIVSLTFCAAMLLKISRRRPRAPARRRNGPAPAPMPASALAPGAEFSPEVASSPEVAPSTKAAFAPLPARTNGGGSADAQKDETAPAPTLAPAAAIATTQAQMHAQASALAPACAPEPMRAPKPEPSPPGVADALACAAAAVAFGWSKFANVLPAALMALVFGAIIVFAQAGGPAGRAASRRRKAAAAAAVCATAAALAALFAIYAAVPRWMESQTTYNAIYFGILRDAGEGEAEGYLRDMGVNPAYARLRDTNYYVEDIGERIKAASAAAGRAGAPAAEVALSETWDATSASAGIADAEIGRAGVADAESAVAANARREAASVTADATPDAPAAEAPASQAAALGLEPAESALAAAAPANSAAGRAEYLVSKPELLLFYLGHPSRLLRALDISLKNAGFIRPYYLSNFGAQRPRLSFAGRFSLWGRFRAQAGFDTAYGALALMLASALALWRAVARRTARRAPGNLRGGRRGGAGRRFGMAARDALVFAGALCACAAIVFYAFAIPIVSNGEADLAKHMFLYAHLSDMMFLFALASAMNSPAQAAPGAAPAQGSASAPRRPLLAQDLAICACLAVLLALPPASRQLGSFVMARASHAAPEAGAYVSFGRMAGGAVGDAVTAGAAGVAVGEPIVWRIAAVNGGDGNHANDDGSDDSNSGNNGSNGDSGDSGSGNGNAGNANSSNDDNAGNSDARGDNSVDGAGSADSGNRGNSDNGDNGGAGGNGSGNSGNDSNHNGGASGAGDSSRSRASGDGGATALLVSEGAVASMPFSADNSGDWEGSGLREWLNGAFLECFSDDELGLILPYERDVLLSVETKGRAERGDRDFYATHVPSLSARGFDTAYRRRVTDMVALPDIQAVAAASDGGAATALGGGPAYWLCSPYYNNGQMARCVFPDGFVYFQDAKETLAVRPAIMIDMSGPRAGSGNRDDPYVLGHPISRSGA